MFEKPERTASGASRYLPLLVTTVLALAILAAIIFLTTIYVRQKGRDQITGQDARILYELWLSQKWTEGTESSAGRAERVSDELRSLLETTRLPQLSGLLGTRLFDTNGACVWTDPPTVPVISLTEDEMAGIRRLQPSARWQEKANPLDVATLISPEPPPQISLVLVSIPLHTPGQSNLVGVAQFLIDGANVAADYKALDRTLIVEATLAFLAGGGLLVVVLVVGFEKLQRANRLLSERTQSLLRANQELALAAKTSAVGAVTAHLIHGLRNPLSGLQNFVASRAAGIDDKTDTEWKMAAVSTRRMQTMISEIVRVLRDEDGDAQYELSLSEFAEMIEARVQPLAREAGVSFETEIAAQGILRNREANLLSLVLYNLVQNAIQATPKGKSVTLAFRSADGRVACEVKDEGAGISDGQRAQLFQPCRSAKEGGSGIGLAISKQLSNCIGAELLLQESTPNGSVFRLVFDSQCELGQTNPDTEGVSSNH